MSELHEAVRRGDVSAVFDLLKGGHDAEALDQAGRPPLWYLLEAPVRDDDDWEQRAAIVRMMELHGVSMSADLERHLAAREERERARLGFAAKPDPEAVSGGDLGITWRCGVSRRPDKIRIWLLDHPEIRVVGETEDDAIEMIMEDIMEHFGDCEPNIEFGEI